VFAKIARLYHTLKYLKLIQIFYQVWYRIKNKFLKINLYTKYNHSPIYFLQTLIAEDVIVSEEKFLKPNHFKFLNLEKQFGEKINWNFLEHGKLWNYNLQYFDYLQNESVSIEQREKLLENFSEALIASEVKLEPYPVSLRIINTIIFISKHKIKNLAIDKALKQQINYLENNLEYHLLANHLLENIFALFISAFALQNKKLFITSNKLLHQQLEEQILNNGAHYELSPMYHSIILSKLLLCIDVCEQNEFGKNINYNYLHETASKMLGWINEYSFSDGSWALMNDAALGIAPTTQQLINAANKLEIKSSKTSLGECGFYKLKNTDAEVLITTGKISPTYQPGHAHSHGLHFCMFLKSKQVIVDTGISTYNNTQQRWYERSTVAHNTVVINNQNQSDVWGAFRVGKRCKVKIINSDNKNFQASVIHSKGKHTRAFLLENNSLVISDNLSSNNIAKGKVHFNTNEQLQKKGQEFITYDYTISLDKSSLNLKETFISNQYNKLQSVACLEYCFNQTASIKISWK
jgi:hypothetical protein